MCAARRLVASLPGHWSRLRKQRTRDACTIKGLSKAQPVVSGAAYVARRSAQPSCSARVRCVVCALAAPCQALLGRKVLGGGQEGLAPTCRWRAPVPQLHKQPGSMARRPGTVLSASRLRAAPVHPPLAPATARLAQLYGRTAASVGCRPGLLAAPGAWVLHVDSPRMSGHSWEGQRDRLQPRVQGRAHMLRCMHQARHGRSRHARERQGRPSPWAHVARRPRVRRLFRVAGRPRLSGPG